jgi:YVTN family beta-propeller protein
MMTQHRSPGILKRFCGKESTAMVTRKMNPRSITGWGLILCALVVISLSHFQSAAASSAPKAYVGIFKDNVVAVIDTGTNSVLKTIPVPPGPHGMAITPDGQTVYVSSEGDSKVSVIDTVTDTVKTSIEVGKTPHGLRLTPDAKQLLVAGFGTDSIIFIDTATNQVTDRVPVTQPHNIAISPDGHTAYISAYYAAAQDSGPVKLIILNLQDKTQMSSVSIDHPARGLNFSPDGKQLYFTETGIDAVEVLDPGSNTVVTQIPVGAAPHLPLFTPDGTWGFVVSQTTNELTLITASTNKVAATIPVGKKPHWIALSGDAKLAYVTNEVSNDISIVDIAAQKVIATIPVGQAPRKIVIQPSPLATPDASSTATATGS